jgi:outer membrane protein OmpA-like peptidoglycan-associated protein
MTAMMPVLAACRAARTFSRTALFILITFSVSLTWAQSNCRDEDLAGAQKLAVGSEKIARYQQLLADCPVFSIGYQLAIAQIDSGDFANAEKTLNQVAAKLLDRANTLAAGALYGRIAQAQLGRRDLVAAHGSMAIAVGMFERTREAEKAANGTSKTANPRWFDEVRKSIETALGQPVNIAQASKVLEANLSGGSTVQRSFGVKPSVDLRVQFDFDKASLTPAGKDMIEKMIEVFHRAPSSETIWFVGHTDTRGRPDYNQKLSELRAETVLKSVAQGLPNLAERLKSCGLGASSPTFSGAADEDHALNRRVQIAFDGKVCDRKSTN